MSREYPHDLKTYAPDFNQLGIDILRIEKAMGHYENGSPEPFPGLIRAQLFEISRKMDIQGGYRILDHISVDRDEATLRVDEVSFEIGTIIANQLHGSQSVAVFACTVGEGVTAESKTLMANGDMIRAYIVDTIGSVAVESAMDFIQEDLARKAAGQHKKMTNRFSPGYCGWHIFAQRDLFSLLPDRFCGITLTDSFLMRPMKSVSGVIGLGSGVKRLEYPCEICDKKDCFRRWRD